jgi:5'-methylthioadenosine phosphorylase
VEVVILARHGKNHSISPSNVNYRANIYALKQEGCTHIIATTACGSLRREMEPGDLVFLDQFIDRTSKRNLTFHDDKVVHTPMSEPFCKEMRNLLSETADWLGFTNHKRGTMVTIEGPRFSTKAESRMFQSWGADVINMSLVPEVILAREMGIHYASIAMVTDYDCWLEDREPVTWDMILNTMNENSSKVKSLILNAIPRIRDYGCEYAKKDSFSTQTDIKSLVRTIPHWPKPGIMFRDITTLIKNPEGFKSTIDQLYQKCKDKNISKIVAIESRGFIFGSVLAYLLGVGFVPVRKKGKLPGETERIEYGIEYGTDTMEMHKDAIENGDNVLIIDDLIATGGTIKAAISLVEKMGGHVSGCAFVIDLPDLKGKEKLGGYDVTTLISFEGE